ncbi:hypothetical protein VTN31DRAFT_2061 [Thermomyces dupontii]|uniref:uncharacterized protein n=1 Tax=Talaromyces thermophilus TaxID=28565 RepID=UPI003743AA71
MYHEGRVINPEPAEKPTDRRNLSLAAAAMLTRSPFPQRHGDFSEVFSRFDFARRPKSTVGLQYAFPLQIKATQKKKDCRIQERRNLGCGPAIFCSKVSSLFRSNHFSKPFGTDRDCLANSMYHSPAWPLIRRLFGKFPIPIERLSMGQSL